MGTKLTSFLASVGRRVRRTLLSSTALMFAAIAPLAVVGPVVAWCDPEDPCCPPGPNECEPFSCCYRLIRCAKPPVMPCQCPACFGISRTEFDLGDECCGTCAPCGWPSHSCLAVSGKTIAGFAYLCTAPSPCDECTQDLTTATPLYQEGRCECSIQPMLSSPPIVMKGGQNAIDCRPDFHSTPCDADTGLGSARPAAACSSRRKDDQIGSSDKASLRNNEHSPLNRSIEALQDFGS